MKRNILKTLMCLTVIALIGSCSSEDSVQMNDTTNTAFSEKSGVWDGVIGEERNGSYFVTGNKAGIIADLEQSMAQMGMPTSISNLIIVEKTAENNANDKAFFLVGVGSNNTSIGVLLNKTGNTFVVQRASDQSFVRTACRGCASGCHLKYYTIEDQRIAYCDEIGCVYDCEKLQFD